jgi:hypothetical protein
MGELRASTSGDVAIAGCDFLRTLRRAFFGGDFFDMQ